MPTGSNGHIWPRQLSVPMWFRSLSIYLSWPVNSLEYLKSRILLCRSMKLHFPWIPLWCQAKGLWNKYTTAKYMWSSMNRSPVKESPNFVVFFTNRIINFCGFWMPTYCFLSERLRRLLWEHKLICNRQCSLKGYVSMDLKWKYPWLENIPLESSEIVFDFCIFAKN